jgi:hypothetical protein
MNASEDFLLCLKQDLKAVSGRMHAGSKFMSGKERLSICNGCGRYNSLLKICKECKCFMPIKVNLAGENCPIGKW